MSRTALLGLAIVLLAGGVLLVAPQLASRWRATAALESQPLGEERDESFQKDAGWLTSYALTERSGRTFRSESLDGKVKVINFFFTVCPTACPLQTAKVQELDREFGPQGVHFLSITCDPDTDTPAVLQQYAAKYQADPERWLFLTGEFDYIRRVAAEVYWAPLSKRGHREDFTVVDKWGKVRGNFPWNDVNQMSEMKELLITLLAETEPPAEPAPTAPQLPEEEADAVDESLEK